MRQRTDGRVSAPLTYSEGCVPNNKRCQLARASCVSGAVLDPLPVQTLEVFVALEGKCGCPHVIDDKTDVADIHLTAGNWSESL